MIGKHLIRTWAKTQETIALSSGGAALYAAVKAGCDSLGVKSIMNDMGKTGSIRLKTDASATIGTLSRTGLGKLRHVNVNYLWFQQKQAKNIFKVDKVWGLENPADAFTKVLDWNSVQAAMTRISTRFEGQAQHVAERVK